MYTFSDSKITVFNLFSQFDLYSCWNACLTSQSAFSILILSSFSPLWVNLQFYSRMNLLGCLGVSTMAVITQYIPLQNLEGTGRQVASVGDQRSMLDGMFCSQPTSVELRWKQIKASWEMGMELPTVRCQVVTRTDGSRMISTASHINGYLFGSNWSGKVRIKCQHLCEGENMSEKLTLLPEIWRQRGMPWNQREDTFSAFIPAECTLRLLNLIKVFSYP